MNRKIDIFVLAALAIIFLAGCTISNGVFVGMSQSSSDTSLCASYVSFDGSLARCVSLSAGEKVTFQYEGGDGLKAAVKKDGETLMEIADGAVFTAPEKGQYRFTVEGEAKEGAFSLFWQSE